jgi:hypothetical protein
LKKKKIDVVVSRTSSYSLLASLLLSLNKKIKIMTYKASDVREFIKERFSVTTLRQFEKEHCTKKKK